MSPYPKFLLGNQAIQIHIVVSLELLRGSFVLLIGLKFTILPFAQIIQICHLCINHKVVHTHWPC
jgi:hypothetical protein